MGVYLALVLHHNFTLHVAAIAPPASMIPSVQHVTEQAWVSRRLYMNKLRPRP